MNFIHTYCIALCVLQYDTRMGSWWWSDTISVTTRQVVLLDLSSFGGSAKREVTILIRSGLRDKALSTYTPQRRLVRVTEVRWRVSKSQVVTILERQEVELKVLPLRTRRFKYIIEVALKLLFESRNPKTAILGMTPYDAIVQ